MHRKEKSCLGVRELLENKGKCGTHFSGTFFQCSPRHRSRHWCGHSDRRSYRGGCKQLGKERKCSVHQNRGDQHCQNTGSFFKYLCWESSSLRIFLAGVGKVSPQRVIGAVAWVEALILCCLW